MERQKALRLQSLQLSPESFSSTYAREAKFIETDRGARLQNPVAFTLVAISLPEKRVDGLEVDVLLNGAWVGMVVLIGSLVRDPSFSPNDSCDQGKEDGQRPVPSRNEYGVDGLFVLPEARRLGIGQLLLQTAMDHAYFVGRNEGFDEVNIMLSVSFSLFYTKSWGSVW